MSVDLDELVDEVPLVNHHPAKRDELRRSLRTLLGNQCVEGPLGGPVLAAADGELVGHVADLEFSLDSFGRLEVFHEHTHEEALIGRVDPPDLADLEAALEEGSS